MPEQGFTFGPFVLNPHKGTLLRLGEPVAVGQRAILLLQALLSRPGEVLSKAELLDAAWSGMAVEESNLSVQIASLRKLLGRSSDGGEWISTIPRIGYRFVGEVDGPRPPATQSPKVAPISRSAPSIAVLPFANLSDDPDQEYFAEGLADDIITGLSRLRWLLVIARNSSFTYRSRGIDVKEIGRELGAKYILEGSVRRSGDRMRTTAELIDASTGLQVWAERYDGEVADVFALQDQITESVVASLEPHLYAAEGFRSQPRTPESLDAWGFVMRAMPYIWTWASADNEKALVYLKRATEIDPAYARANSLIAWVYAARMHTGWASIDESLELALTFAKRAVEQDGEDPWAHLALGWVHSMSRRYRPALAELMVSLELNPNFAFGHAMLGMAHGYAGHSDEGLQHLFLAVRLSPRDPQQARYLSSIGLCHFMARRFAEAVEFERRAVQLRPHFLAAWRTLAAAAALTGDQELAVSALAEAKRLQPDVSIDWIERYLPIVQEEDRAIYIEGLRAAGLK
jgi:TolB-like protein/tetratricopeptide (TPR) repeat protein